MYGDDLLCLPSHNQTPVGSAYVHRSQCKNAYHCGKCSGITKAAFMAMNNDKCNAWTHGACQLHAKRQSEAKSSPITDQASQTDPDTLALFTKQGAECLEKLAQLIVRIGELKNNSVLEIPGKNKSKKLWMIKQKLLNALRRQSSFLGKSTTKF